MRGFGFFEHKKRKKHFFIVLLIFVGAFFLRELLFFRCYFSAPMFNTGPFLKVLRAAELAEYVEGLPLEKFQQRRTQLFLRMMGSASYYISPAFSISYQSENLENRLQAANKFLTLSYGTGVTMEQNPGLQRFRLRVDGSFFSAEQTAAAQVIPLLPGERVAVGLPRQEEKKRRRMLSVKTLVSGGPADFQELSGIFSVTKKSSVGGAEESHQMTVSYAPSQEQKTGMSPSYQFRSCL